MAREQLIKLMGEFECEMKEKGLIVHPYLFQKHINYEEEQLEYRHQQTFIAFKAWQSAKSKIAQTPFCADDVKFIIANGDHDPYHIVSLLIGMDLSEFISQLGDKP